MSDSSPAAEPGATPPDATLARFRDFYREFSPAWVERLEELYHPDAFFADAFHTFQRDLPGMKRYFRSIPEKLSETRFLVDGADRIEDGAVVFWRWEFRIWSGDPLRCAPGVTHLRFAEDGRIRHHRDYFDGAVVYEAMPVLGPVLRLLKSRF